MRFVKAIIEGYEIAKEKYGKEQALYHVGLYKNTWKKQIVFTYMPEYTVIKKPLTKGDVTTLKILDPNCWRCFDGGWLDMCLNETWMIDEDWEYKILDEN